VRLLVIVIGIVAAAIGILGIAAPAVLLDFGRSLETPAALYVVGALRVCFGIVLIRAASISRAPATFRVLGVFLIVVGVFTPFFGAERSRALLEWWADRGSAFFRAAVGLAIVFGLFLVWAVTARPPASGRSPA
jgi:uncharacterized membrane protein YidH (DUF202 family)